MLFYASAVRLDAPIASLWLPILTLLGALVPGAVYVSLINDLTDLEADRAAAKPNRLAGTGRWRALAGIAPCVAAGAGFAFAWRHDTLLLALYGGAWLAFTLYSVPPVRLKARGLAGLVADAAGANLFPGLLAAALATSGTGAAQDPVWLATLGCWIFAYGLRGILWHQLGDAEADRIAGVGTFIQRHGRRGAAILGKAIALPVECVAMGLLLWQAGAAAAVPALVLYAWLVRRRLALFRMQLTLLEPKPRSMLLPQEYYDLFLPVALLIGSAIRHPVDLAIIAAHILLFPRRPIQVAADAWRLWR
jgi:4-hydroxybenzoate polyprenyltransferase